MSRRARSGEVVCRCKAYRRSRPPNGFPHRQFGGRCNPLAWVKEFFGWDKRECRDCHCFNGLECEVCVGVETTFQCPALRDYVRYEDIILYGRARQLMELVTAKG